jgi:DNA-binding NtrC family response regulator
MELIGFQIDDPASRMTLKVMLEAEGHSIVDGDRGTPLLITDNMQWAVEHISATSTVLVLSRAEQVSTAVQCMRRGVYGYIFLPFQPGEASLMVQRALDAGGNGPVAGVPDSIQPLEAVESAHILDTLRRCKNNQAKTARVLGIGRNTLWRKLKKIETLQKMARQD